MAENIYNIRNINNHDVEITSETNNAKNYIKKLKEENMYYERMIQNNKYKIREMEKNLFKMCNHQWVRDEFAAFDDHIKQVCDRCGLYNCSAYYRD